jgi:hypothetical protein
MVWAYPFKLKALQCHGYGESRHTQRGRLLVREAFWQSMQVGSRHTHIFRKPPIKLDASLKAVHKDRLAWLKIGRLALYDLACDFDASDTRKGGDDLG